MSMRFPASVLTTMQSLCINLSVPRISSKDLTPIPENFCKNALHSQNFHVKKLPQNLRTSPYDWIVQYPTIDPRGTSLIGKCVRDFFKTKGFKRILDGFFLKTKGFLLKVYEIFGSEMPLTLTCLQKEFHEYESIVNRGKLLL